ncbi:MAG: TVP38/TMEM64 family protein [Bacteroidota bacterium]|nr:TVP38/TMEM64 family protein [Bacteroidota bacterium]
MKNNNKLGKLVLLALAFLIIIAAAAVILYETDFLKGISIDSVKHYINSFGKFSILIFMLIFVMRTFLVVFPYSITVILGGSLFGQYLGFTYNMIATLISASLAFFIGRYAGKDIVAKLLKGRIDKYDLKVEKHGFKIIFFMRISIIFPFDIMNYAAGLSKLKYRDFILGTALGVAPEVFSLTSLGSSLSQPMSFKFLISIGMVCITIFVPVIFKRLKKNKVRARDDFHYS